MKYFATIASLIAAVKAASLGNTDYSVTAGITFTITWYDAQGEVTLDLRNGKSGDLKQLSTIVAGATSDDGKGSFTWTVPSTFASEGPYAIVITDSTGVNYSPQFPIEGAAVEEETKPTTTEKTTAAPTTTAKSTLSAEAVKPTTTAFEFQSSSSLVPTHSSTKGGSSTLATKTKTDSSKPTDDTPAPTTVPDGEGNAARMASPLALILVSVAAMFYLQ